jgi:hypothetical protein
MSSCRLDATTKAAPENWSGFFGGQCRYYNLSVGIIGIPALSKGDYLSLPMD